MELTTAIRLVLEDEREQDPNRAQRGDEEIIGELRDSRTITHAEIDDWVEAGVLTSSRLTWAYHAILDATGDDVRQALA